LLKAERAELELEKISSSCILAFKIFVTLIPVLITDFPVVRLCGHVFYSHS